MKRLSCSRFVLGLTVAWGLTAATVAVAKPSQRDDDERTPAAPEPAVLAMAAAGLALGGGYVLWRRRSHNKSNT